MEKENKLEILIAEDDKLMKELVVEICEDFYPNYKIKSFEDGKDLRNYIESDKNNIALVITDNSVPVQDLGLNIIKEYSSKVNFPMILMSGEHEKKDEVLDSGAYGFLKKPFGLEELEKMTLSALKKYHEENETTKRV